MNGTDVPTTPVRDEVAALWAAAFQDDPVTTFFFPDPAMRRRRLPRVFAALYDGDVPHGGCYVTAGHEAATLWRKPGSPHEPLWQMLLHAPSWLAAFGAVALPRALAFSLASDANHPPEPHWYLHVAGCDPAHQGRGHGRAAIEAGLARADRDGVPAYLETANARNIGYYLTFGFRVTHEWRTRGGPPTWSMFRPTTGLRSSYAENATEIA